VSSGNNKLILNDSYPLVKSCTKSSSQKAKRELVIIGDSHARGRAVRVKNLISEKSVVCGFVKPGSAVNILIRSAKNEIMNLTNREIIVFWGGVNDVSKNNSEIGLRHIIKFVKGNGHTKSFY
jgi:hypothetical protein